MTSNEDRDAPVGAERGDGVLTRRVFLRDAGAAGIAVSGSGLLGAWGGIARASSASGPRLVAQTPSRGGTLRVGIAGNGTSENYNPALVASPIDFLHAYSVFDVMVRPAPNYAREPGLVLDWVPNTNATVYELKLRGGVTWHDGKAFGADDIIYTLRSLASPSNLGNAAVANVRLNDLKKLGPLTVQVPLKIPIADLAAYFLTLNAAYVIQNGVKSFAKPVGTGAYKLVSFTPGQRSVLTANRDYWDHPSRIPTSCRSFRSTMTPRASTHFSVARSTFVAGSRSPRPEPI